MTKTSRELSFDQSTEHMKRSIRVEKYILQEYSERNEVHLYSDIPIIID